MKHPIPRKALDDRLGFIGTSGSGKTYNAGTAIEILLSQKARAVIIDPLGVWWGLRLLADGKKASGFDVVIFGGDHADLPLNEQAGALIGETAATMAESCIIDLSKLTSRAAERRFMVAFLETIYRKAGGEPFHLIVDEADLFAPQKPQAGDEVLLGHMENIVRRGRVRGFIPWLISQRPAVLNKNVLSQVDGLIAFKLTSVQDRDALDAWIEGQADKAQGKALKDALPTFPIGHGVVWLPGHGILENKAFPPKVTFDSSKKPKRGEKATSRKLKPLDVGKLEKQLAAFVEQAKANDLPTLRKRNTELEAQLRKAEAAKPAAAPPIDKAADKKAAAEREDRARVRGKVDGYGEAMKDIAAIFRDLTNATAKLRPAIDAIEANAKNIEGWMARWKTKQAELATQLPSGPPAATQIPADTPTRATAAASPAARKPSPAARSDLNVSPAQQRILDAIAWMASLGNPQVPKDTVAFLADTSQISSAYKNNLGSLRSAGLLNYPVPGCVQLTEDGAAIAKPPADAPTHQAIMQKIAAKLAPAQMRILECAAGAFPLDLEKNELAETIGASATSSAFKNNLGRLRGLGFITYPSSGHVRAGEGLFP